ncbi:GspE/PulE family protein [Neptuniibacter sp. QD72_48]|uniref:GspE/PulE family protein n=1 Tax=Neptuniibacter sp. QD72_48 TaxID=3398214 RepID=UPI0039F50DDC
MAAQENSLLNAGTQAGLIDPIMLPELKSNARRSGTDLIELLCRTGRYPKTALYQALADSRSLPFLDRESIEIDTNLLNPFNADTLLRRMFAPVRYQGELYVLLSDPDDRMGLDTVQRIIGKRATPALADPALIESIIRKHFNVYEIGANAVTIIDDIMKEAYICSATDLHFEPQETGMLLRMRVDGKMQSYERPISKELSESLMSRIKVLAGLDIAEQNMAQDGGFSYKIQDWFEVDEVELRVATIPSRWGEKATLRVLGQSTAGQTLSDLGMPDHILTSMKQALAKPHGIILVTGPTGSGKSTTLYASLRELDASQLNILTVEDPIEQVVEGTTQVQVSEKVSFSKALRSFLRHDPDVMLVGEIRDNETAETAVRAAMTGHMVLSTLHTNSAVATVNRLIDIGCPRYLISSTLAGVLAQRLLRRLCSHCKEAYQPDQREREILQLSQSEDITLYRNHGCPQCTGSGYRGRVGIYETLWIDKEIELLIHSGAEDEQIAEAAAGAGLLSTLWQDARDKVLEGTTSLQEAMHLY